MPSYRRRTHFQEWHSYIASDHKDASFGTNYGFLIEELRLLSRGVVVINKDNKVTYVEYVPEVTQAVNFDAALEAIKADI